MEAAVEAVKGTEATEPQGLKAETAIDQNAPIEPVKTEKKSSKQKVSILDTRIFRPNSKARDKVVNFILHSGGIGDYLCAIPALEYVAEYQPNVYGEVFVVDAMVEIVAHILKKYPRWTVFGREATIPAEKANQPGFMPFLRPVNATGCHLLDLGFIYYANLHPPHEDFNRYPILDLSEIQTETPAVRYAVMTPGATTLNRTMKSKAFNGIKDHLVKLGIVPVFLGKKTITDIRAINYEADYDYSGGLDLREQTTLFQAAGIMSKAELVVGLDNGLLHLAACTDVPILFGYNIASPEHRRPRRASGNIWEIYPDPKELPCTFCQSRMRFLFDHDFANCVYRDNKCLDILNDPKLWTDKIDDLLDKTGKKAVTLG